MYFVISNLDGDTTVEPVSEKVLKERLAEEYYGKVEFKASLDIGNRDTNYWGEKILIIKSTTSTDRHRI